MSGCPKWVHCHGSGGGGGSGGWEIVALLAVVAVVGVVIETYIWYIVGFGVPALIIFAWWKISRALGPARQRTQLGRAGDPAIEAYRAMWAERAAAAAAPPVPAITPPAEQHVHLHFDGMTTEEAADVIRRARGSGVTRMAAVDPPRRAAIERGR